MTVPCAPWILFAVALASSLSSCRAQPVNVPIPGIGGHKRWYVWLVVSIAGTVLLYTSFFVLRGFLVARKRKKALQAEGLSEEDEVYTAKHAAILGKLLPRSKMPQGKGSTAYSPMLSGASAWDPSQPQPPQTPAKSGSQVAKSTSQVAPV